MDPKNPSLWGVQGLNEAEQREVRGGGHSAGSRAQCIRDHIRSYAAARRSGSGTRSSQLASLLTEIANCSGSGQPE